MKLKRFSIGAVGLLAISGLSWGCSTKSNDCHANLNCGAYDGDLGMSGTSGASGASSASGTGGTSGGASGTSGTSGGTGTSGDGGMDAGAGSAGAPPMCDGTLSPAVDTCVISDEYGLFVSPVGDDTGDGTQAHPFATVTTALARVGKIKRVYVCAGDYEEPATIEIPDRVSIYGGFTCGDGNWKYDAPLPAHLMPQDPVGATISGATVGVFIQDVRLDAANAPDDETGASSFGLAIINSVNVALKRVDIRAGKGAKGGKGADGSTGVDGVASTDAQNGVAGNCTNPVGTLPGPLPVPRQCGSEGGNGGNARVATDYAPSQDGGSGYLVSPSNGGKGEITAGQGATSGHDGSPGGRGDAGAAALSSGSFSASGYIPASGGSGTAGKPGQGGGGGGASLGSATCIGATGGAGGMWGCGGDPGTGGTGGGASVALLSWQSRVSIDGCVLVAVIGGAGGDGGKGHIGGAGSARGLGGAKSGSVGRGGDGGNGGDGGDGGNGAGGTGGPSIALVYDGTAPTQMGTLSLNFAATPALAGKGGTLGPSDKYPGPDGAKGLTQDIYPKPTP